MYKYVKPGLLCFIRIFCIMIWVCATCYRYCWQFKIFIVKHIEMLFIHSMKQKCIFYSVKISSVNNYSETYIWIFIICITACWKKSFFSIMIYYFIYLFLAVLGLCCCTQAFLVAVSGATLHCSVWASYCSSLTCGSHVLGTWAQ